MLFGGMTILSLAAAVSACLGSGLGLHWLWLAPVSFLGSFLSLFLFVFLFVSAMW